jgi:hypothetical protein
MLAWHLLHSKARAKRELAWNLLRGACVSR